MAASRYIFFILCCSASGTMKMWRGEEGKRCGVAGCPNAAFIKRRSKGRRLFGLPRVRVPHSCEDDRKLTKRWRAAWVAALRASGTNCENNALRKMMVCARHFVSGNDNSFNYMPPLGRQSNCIYYDHWKHFGGCRCNTLRGVELRVEAHEK